MKDLNPWKLQAIINEAEFELYAKLRENAQVMIIVIEWILDRTDILEDFEREELLKAITDFKDYFLNVRK